MARRGGGRNIYDRKSCEEKRGELGMRMRMRREKEWGEGGVAQRLKKGGGETKKKKVKTGEAKARPGTNERRVVNQENNVGEAEFWMLLTNGSTQGDR